MSVRAVAVVPSAPLLLPAVSPRLPGAIVDEVDDLRAAVAATLQGLPDVDTIVLLAGGDDATLPDGGRADLVGYGHPQARTKVPVDRDQLAALATRTGTPRVRADHVDGDLAVLTLLVAAHRADPTVSLATVARAAAGATLGGFAAGLLAGIDATGRDVAIVASGDLSATRDRAAPGYLVEGAIAWDQQVLEAVGTGDLDSLVALGPDAASRVGARGWAPLVVLLHLARAAGLELTDPQLWAPRGVGQLVASSHP